MKTKFDVPVGKIVTRNNGKQYLVAEDPEGDHPDTCVFCGFWKKPTSFCVEIPCMVTERTDRKNVVFLRLHPEQ